MSYLFNDFDTIKTEVKLKIIISNLKTKEASGKNGRLRNILKNTQPWKPKIWNFGLENHWNAFRYLKIKVTVKTLPNTIIFSECNKHKCLLVFNEFLAFGKFRNLSKLNSKFKQLKIKTFKNICKNKRPAGLFNFL